MLGFAKLEILLGLLVYIMLNSSYFIVMKKYFLSLFLFFILFSAYSQIPDGYYNSAKDLSGDQLKTSLYNIIKNHIEFPYSSSGTDVWDILKETDRDPVNSSNVILLYSGWSVNAAQEFNNENGWNREHVWAKSRGDFGTNPGPGTDVHHLRPCDITVNAARANRWFDNCDIPYFDGSVNTGSYLSNSSWVWQPRNEVKGDVARMIFYMAVRYEGENGDPDLRIIDFLPADDYTNDPIHAKLSTLLQWHLEDQVNDFERNRNEVAFQYQKNRNPFIDHPEYAEMIWSSTSSSNSKEMYSSTISIFPNPAEELVYFDNPGKLTIDLYSLTGKKLKSTRDDRMFLDELETGIYFLRVTDQNGKLIEVKKLIKK